MRVHFARFGVSFGLTLAVCTRPILVLDAQLTAFPASPLDRGRGALLNCAGLALVMEAAACGSDPHYESDLFVAFPGLLFCFQHGHTRSGYPFIPSCEIAPELRVEHLNRELKSLGQAVGFAIPAEDDLDLLDFPHRASIDADAQVGARFVDEAQHRATTVAGVPALRTIGAGLDGEDVATLHGMRECGHDVVPVIVWL